MKRSASEIIRNLEMRIAKLEKTSSDAEFYIEAIMSMFSGLDDLQRLKDDDTFLSVINKKDLDKVLSVERELISLKKSLGG